MSNNELIDYIVKSIEGCDRLKCKYANKPDEHSKEMSKIFEGMSEAYCDIYEKLSGESYDTPSAKQKGGNKWKKLE